MKDSVMNMEETNKIETMMVPYRNENLMKSNLLIGAKYKASLNELRMTYTALYAIQNGDYREEADGIYVTFSGSEIKRLIGSRGNGIYDALKSVAQGMTSRSMGYSNPETNEFDYITLITRATYKGGVFQVKFNSDVKRYILNLKGDFTNLNRLTMMSFQSAYSFRLYELLKKQCYYPKSYTGPRNNIFEIKINLAELKFEMGVANAELESVKKILTGETPDYEKALEKAEMSPDHISSYSQWNSFKKRCLNIAVEEISEPGKTDLHVEYSTEQSGRGGKVTAVIFIVTLKQNQNKHQDADNSNVIDVDQLQRESVCKLSDSERKSFHVMVLNELDNEDLSMKDARIISETAAYDMDRIKKAVKVAQASSTDIKNYVGFLIKAIEDDYEEPVMVKGSGKSQRGSSKFNNFPQRSYDYDALERKLSEGWRQDS